MAVLLLRLVFLIALLHFASCLLVEARRLHDCQKYYKIGSCSSNVVEDATPEKGSKFTKTEDERRWAPESVREAAAAASGEWDGQLRLVPSGPDPLHHNRSPRKPQTP